MSVNWTLGEIMSSATAALGNRSDIAASRASFWANVAHEEVFNANYQNLSEKLALSSTTSGEDKITLPTDFGEPITISIWGSSSTATTSSTLSHDVLTQLSVDDVDSQTTARGKPHSFLLYADWMELRPVPNSDYSVQMRYVTKVPTLSATTDRLSVDTAYGHAVYCKTTEYLAREVRDLNSQAFFESEYRKAMNAVVPDRARRLRQRKDLGFALPRKRP